MQESFPSFTQFLTVASEMPRISEAFDMLIVSLSKSFLPIVTLLMGTNKIASAKPTAMLYNGMV